MNCGVIIKGMKAMNNMNDLKQLELKYVDSEIAEFFKGMNIDEYPWGFPIKLQIAKYLKILAQRTNYEKYLDDMHKAIIGENK